MGGFAGVPFFGIQAKEGREFAGEEAGTDACGHVVAGYFGHKWARQLGEEKRHAAAERFAEREGAE